MLSLWLQQDPWTASVPDVAVNLPPEKPPTISDRKPTLFSSDKPWVGEQYLRLSAETLSQAETAAKNDELKKIKEAAQAYEAEGEKDARERSESRKRKYHLTLPEETPLQQQLGVSPWGRYSYLPAEEQAKIAHSRHERRLARGRSSSPLHHTSAAAASAAATSADTTPGAGGTGGASQGKPEVASLNQVQLNVVHDVGKDERLHGRGHSGHYAYGSASTSILPSSTPASATRSLSATGRAQLLHQANRREERPPP